MNTPTPDDSPTGPPSSSNPSGTASGNASSETVGGPPGEESNDASPTHANNLFGNRADDPLLQDDPLPEGPRQEQSGAARSDQAGSDQAPSDQAPSQGEPARHASSSPPPESESPESARQDPSQSHGPGRTLLISQEAAAAGDLAPVNAALERGWRLDSVRLRPDRASESTAPSLAFHVTRPSDGS